MKPCRLFLTAAMLRVRESLAAAEGKLGLLRWNFGAVESGQSVSPSAVTRK
jgi:hypothetical protein